jgi:arabinogalactan oligomer/maltooligosaccharide transport system substrate-binding protein
VLGAHDWIGNLVQNGAIDPLQLTPDQLSAYSDVAVKATTYDEQLYGLPYGVESLVLYRNTDLAPEAPATLDDAFAAGQALVAAGKAESPFNIPIGEQGDAYHMQPLYTSAGGYVFGRNAEGDYDPADLGVGNPASLEAAKKIASLGEGGAKVLSRSVTNDNSIALFAAGKAPFLLSGPWAKGDVEKAGFGYAIQPVPGFKGMAPAKPFAGVQAFFVASKGKNKAFAQEFVANTMNTPEAMQTMFDMANLPPALTALQESAGASDPDLKAYLDAANAGEPMPAIPQMQSVFEPLGKAYAAIVGGADPVGTMQATGKTITDTIAG